MTLKVAFIGAGSMAEAHLKVYRSLPDVHLAGIHSRTPSKATELAHQFQIAHVCDSISELYHTTQADLVIITVPELALNSVVKQCFQYNWNVFMEKPAGFDLEDALDIQRASQNFKNKTFVGFNRRFYSSTLQILKDLGTRTHERRYIHVQDQQSFAEARKFNQPEAVIHKYMYANSIHLIDLLPTFARGSIQKITPLTEWQGEKTEVMLATIEYSSGDLALYEGLWKGPGPWSCSISTQSKRWVMQPLEQATFQNAGERSQQLIPKDPLDVEYKPGFYRQAQAIFDSIRNGQGKVVDLDESLATMKLIHSIFRV